MDRREEEEEEKTGEEEQEEEEEEEKKKETIEEEQEEEETVEEEDADEEEEEETVEEEDADEEEEEEQEQEEEEEEKKKETIEEEQDAEEEEKTGEEEDADEEEDDEEDDEDEVSDQLKDEDAADDDDDDADGVKKKKKLVTSCPDRKCVPGIVYLGHIPPRLRPRHLRNLLAVYGEVGRVFLQPEDGEVRKRKRRAGSRRSDFVEGWVEFRDKRIAKRVAASLNNTPMGTRRRQHFTSDLWSIKYLHRFQWTDLSERLSSEALILQQRLRTETSLTKKETNFYLDNVDKDQRRRKLDQQTDRSWDFTQRQTEEEIQRKKKKKRDSVTQKARDKSRLLEHQSQSNVSLLAKIFNSSQ